MAALNVRSPLVLAAASALLVATADADITMSRAGGNLPSSKPSPVPGSQPAVCFDSFGANDFDLSGEAVRLRPEDWDCGACPPKFVGDPIAVAGKVVVGDTRDWGCGSNFLCGPQSFSRELQAGVPCGDRVQFAVACVSIFFSC